MSRETELIKNTMILTIGKICTQFISFLLLPLYTALLIPEEFGIVDLFNTYITLLIPIFGWQFDSGLFRFMIEERKNIERQQKLFSTVFMSNIIQSIIYLAFYMIARNFITSEFKVFLAIDVILNIFLNTLLQFPRGLGNNVQYSFASFISATSTVILNVVFIAGIKMGALGMFIAMIISKIITISYLIFVTKTWKYFKIKLVDINIFKELCRYSFPLIPNQLSWWVIGASDRTIISFFLGVAMNGVYSVANKFSSVYITFYNIFNLSWSESVSLHIDDEDRDEFLSDMSNTIFKLFATICLGIIAVMPFAFRWMINKQYNAAYQQIPILMVAVFFQVIAGLYSVLYIAKKQSSEIAKTSLAAAIINIAVNLGLIKYIGIYAASISTLLSFVFMTIYRYLDSKKYADVHLKKQTILPVIIIGIGTIVFYYINKPLTNVISLGIVLTYAILGNRTFIDFFIGKIFEVLKK